MAVRSSSPADTDPPADPSTGSPTDASTTSPPASSTETKPPPAERDSRGGLMLLCAVAVLVLAVSLFGGGDTSSDTARSDSPRHHSAAAAGPHVGRPASPHAGPSTAPSEHRTGKSLPRSRPVRLLIPKISVDAPFTDLAIGPTGQLEPPPADDVNLVGWHAEGASPGEPGTSIIAGHVDTTTSAAVFAGLGALEKGDTFRVARADGRTATFVVDSMETFDKKNFPDQRVYGDTPQAQVRLITCAGDYDSTARDYTQNLVVFAHLV